MQAFRAEDIHVRLHQASRGGGGTPILKLENISIWLALLDSFRGIFPSFT